MAAAGAGAGAEGVTKSEEGVEGDESAAEEGVAAEGVAEEDEGRAIG